jgi:ADP-heptose:LPS heptosyltransferase
MNIFPKNMAEKTLFALEMLLAKYINRNKKINLIDVKHILCVKLDEIGDLCYALHVFDVLHATYPNAKITLWCKPYCNTLVQQHPAINKVINLQSQLTEKVDIFIDLRGSWMSLWYAIKKHPYLYLERGSVRYKNKKTGHPHEVITNLQIIKPLLNGNMPKPNPKLYIADENVQKAKQFLQENKIGTFAIVHPGARKPLKKWQPKRFVNLCKWLKEKYGYDIVFAGDKTELNDISNIQQQITFKTYSIAGILNLTDFAALVRMAKLYVGNDSGPLSIASISGTPSLGLFGPGVPDVFYPYGEKTDYIHYVLPCNPCDQVNCIRPHDNCMDKIEVAEVKQKIISLLGV